MNIGGGCHSYPSRIRNQKLFIFDGPDGCGKTNIAQALGMTLKIPYFKPNCEFDYWRQGRFKEALEFDQTYLVQLLEQTDYSLIMDRAYPAEWVYSKVYKRETNKEVLEKVDHAFAALGTVIVMPLRHDYSKSKKEDEIIAKEMLPLLDAVYEEFAEWTKCSVVKIYVDGFEDNLGKEMHALLPELEMAVGERSIRTNIMLDREIRKLERFK